MVMNAYNREYLPMAQKTLGDMMDFAVNSCNFEADQFFAMFIASGFAKQFGDGNVTFICGMTGCELARRIVVKVGLPPIEIADEMFLDKTPEYWSGWALAYYQWNTGQKFSKIVKAVPLSNIIAMYSTMHEADILRFVHTMNDKMHAFYKETNLKRFRMLAGYSQSELADASQVSLRQIQLFEQRQRNINRASAECVVCLAKALACDVTDLLEMQ